MANIFLLLPIFDIMCRWAEHIYNILNGKAVIYTSEIRQIVRGMRERGFNITEDDIDFSNLRIKYHSYTWQYGAFVLRRLYKRK